MYLQVQSESPQTPGCQSQDLNVSLTPRLDDLRAPVFGLEGGTQGGPDLQDLHKEHPWLVAPGTDAHRP